VLGGGTAADWEVSEVSVSLDGGAWLLSEVSVLSDDDWVVSDDSMLDDDDSPSASRSAQLGRTFRPSDTTGREPGQ
jgi:hypothetical protein